jgi:hypothetical protein
MMMALNPVNDSESGKHHFGIHTRRIRNRYHGDSCAIGQRKQRHQSRQRLDLSRSELAERSFLLRHDGRLTFQWLIRQEPFNDRRTGSAL